MTQQVLTFSYHWRMDLHRFETFASLAIRRRCLSTRTSDPCFAGTRTISNVQVDFACVAESEASRCGGRPLNVRIEDTVKTMSSLNFQSLLRDQYSNAAQGLRSQTYSRTSCTRITDKALKARSQSIRSNVVVRSFRLVPTFLRHEDGKILTCVSEPLAPSFLADYSRY